MSDQPKPNAPKSAPLVMDVMRPKVAAPDHQLAEHGTPDEAADTTTQPPAGPDVLADELLQQVTMEHASSSTTKPTLPVGLIVVTVVVLVLLVLVAWFALNTAS